MPTRLTLRTELLAMHEEDLAVRRRAMQSAGLAADHSLELEAVHQKNAARMREILAQHGWPTRLLVGVDGEEAAWLVVQHAIGDPELQRRALGLLEQAVASGEAPRWHAAYLFDRIAYFEGRPQRYGTQYDTGPDGYVAVYRLEDPANVDQFRAAVGLSPLEHPSRHDHPPRTAEELSACRAGFEAWTKKVGWRK